MIEVSSPDFQIVLGYVSISQGYEAIHRAQRSKRNETGEKKEGGAANAGINIYSFKLSDVILIFLKLT